METKENKETKENLLLFIKHIARVRIETILPPHSQRNCLARAIFLIQKESLGGEISADEKNELVLSQSKWDQIKKIRSASDKISAMVDQFETISDITEAYSTELDHYA